jgi:hypothetical protein
VCRERGETSEVETVVVPFKCKDPTSLWKYCECQWCVVENDIHMYVCVSFVCPFFYH